MCASAESSRIRSMPLFARPALAFIIGWVSFCKYGCKPAGFRIGGSLQSAGGLSWRRNTGRCPSFLRLAELWPGRLWQGLGGWVHQLRIACCSLSAAVVARACALTLTDDLASMVRKLSRKVVRFLI